MGYLGIVKIDGTSHKVGSTLFGTCATEAATAAKVVTCSDFTELPTGVTIHVKFTYSNTAANPTLNINSKGAKAIYRYGTTVPGTTAETSWNAGAVVSFTYDGTNFIMNDWINTNTNTDTNVTQTVTNTNANYEVLFSGTADNTTRTEGARKYSNLTFNPSTGTLTTTNVIASTSTLGVADIDTANITEDNVGNLIVTGAARFLNTINGSISGNAATASDSAKLNGYASDTSATNNTIARRTANGYLFATYFNQSSGAETPTSSSYIIYANSDGYFRKSTVVNMKTAMSLNNVENKSSATIRGELTSSNVTTALGYTPVNKAGDTMTGELINQKGGIWVQGGSAAGGNVDRMTLTAGMPTELKYNGGKRGLRLYSNAVAIADPYNGNSNSDAGWIRHIEETSNSSIFEIATGDDGTESIVMRQYNTSSAIAREAKILGADGATSFPVSVTAPKFIGNLQGTADNADKVDGYHIYYDRYVSSTQLSQPTADTIWYVKVSTSNWNSNIEVIQIRTGGNNRTGSHVLYTGSRGTKWWGYCQVYTHRGLSGVYKVISNSDDVYLRFDADCTSATIYTSFTPQTLAIVDSPSDANYTEVPTYGGWYGNQITVDHIQTNNYITIQKKTVASNTFADTNPKIVFKNVDGSQNGSLTWCDYDSVQYPASLTLNGNQGGEYFIAPNIKATGSFYGNLSGTASHSNALNLIASNEIRFGNRPSSAVDVYVNYQWADGTASAMINKYVFMNGNKTKCPVEASKFIGPLQGNADTATTATNTNYLISNTRMDYGWNGVNYFNHSANAGNGVKVNDNPTSAWWHIMRFNHANNSGYYTDFAVPFNDHSLYYKRIAGGSLKDGGWVQVSDALNVGFTYTTTVKYYTHNRKFQVSKSTSAWDAQAYSQSGYVDNVFVTFKPNQTNMALMVGLDSNPSQDASYGNIDYCWYVHNDAKLTMFESGTEISSISGHTTYVAGDELRVEYSGGYIRYYHNGVVCREVARAISGKLYMDSSFHGASSCIYDVSYGPCARNAQYAVSAGTASSASAVAWGNVTGKPSSYPPDAHNHGTLHNDFTVSIANTTEDSGWSMINSTYNGYLLKSIRFQGSSPAWGVGNYGAGICFGGSDTKGILSCAYGSPLVKIAGGNGTKPVWWIGLTGTTGTSYNLASFLTSHQTVTDNNPTLAWGTKSKVATIGSTEINVTMPANPNTDQNVYQSATSTAKWRKIALGAQNDTTAETAVTATTGQVYVTPNVEVQPSTGTIRTSGNLQVSGTVCANVANSSTAGGLSLYSTDPQTYGIIFRGTGNQGKHGYVQSDWATYFTMNSGATTRGWVFKLNQTDGNVASISGAGNAVFNGSVTIGGNMTNTSGCRLVYNQIGSLDFVFV